MATHQSLPGISATGTRHVHGVCPLDCPDTCSWVVTVENGRAVKLLGNREHPYTRGALCEKVNRYLEHTQQPDRLLQPMRRTGKKGEGRFARISWDDALGEIAARWRAIIERDGPQAIWPYYGTGTLGMIQGLAGAGRRLWNALGTTQHHLSICMTPSPPSAATEPDGALGLRRRTLTTTRTSCTIASALQPRSERRLRRRNPLFRGGSEGAVEAPLD